MIIGAEPDRAAGFLEIGTPEKLADITAHQRHAGLAADENDLVEIFWFELCIGQGADAMRTRALDDAAGKVFQFGSSQCVAEAEVRSQERDRNLDLGFSREPNFCLFGHLANPSNY